MYIFVLRVEFLLRHNICVMMSCPLQNLIIVITFCKDLVPMQRNNFLVQTRNYNIPWFKITQVILEQERFGDALNCKCILIIRILGKIIAG